MNGKCKIVMFMLILAGATDGMAQGFMNLDFESANVAQYKPASYDVPVVDGFPDWSVYIVDKNLNITPIPYIWYNGVSTGGAWVSLTDGNRNIAPLQGNYSAELISGVGYGTEIAQTGYMPNGSETLLFDGDSSANGFFVSINGQNLQPIALQNFVNYTLYAVNISAYAGISVTLSFTAPPPPGGSPSPDGLLVDDIRFSASPVPEPHILSLLSAGGLFLFWQHRHRLSRGEKRLHFPR